MVQIKAGPVRMNHQGTGYGSKFSGASMNAKYQKSAANGVSAGAEPISNEDFMKIFGGSQNEL